MDIAAGMEHLHSLGVLHVSLLCCFPRQMLYFDRVMVDQSLGIVLAVLFDTALSKSACSPFMRLDEAKSTM